ncbi:ExbD/TolR family protein [Alienimonas sp. DA493]|uniref:ExbD/TolR family protein n=1 Tax=Alienimonas sp. DA493 TaxID=3373605 RepID=UPI003754B66F
MSESLETPRATHRPPPAEDDDYVPPPREKRKELDFDITPMIDVVFLLLIFFMVSSTMQEPAKSDAPPAVHGQGIDAAGTIKVILLPERGGEYEVELPDGEIVPLEEALETDRITAAVAAARAANPSKNEVVLLADRDATAEQTFPILRQIGEVEGVSVHNEVQDPR